MASATQSILFVVPAQSVPATPVRQQANKLIRFYLPAALVIFFVLGFAVGAFYEFRAEERFYASPSTQQYTGLDGSHRYLIDYAAERER